VSREDGEQEGVIGTMKAKTRTVYLLLCLAGTVLPYLQLVPFVREHGLDLRLFIEQLFSTRIGSFFGWDVIVSSIVLWIFVFVEGRRAGVRNLWAPIAANLAVGVSLGLPLFLYMREKRMGATTAG
jgi:Terpene cyclase DEP1